MWSSNDEYSGVFNIIIRRTNWSVVIQARYELLVQYVVLQIYIHEPCYDKAHDSLFLLFMFFSPPIHYPSLPSFSVFYFFLFFFSSSISRIFIVQHGWSLIVVLKNCIKAMVRFLFHPSISFSPLCLFDFLTLFCFNHKILQTN